MEPESFHSLGAKTDALRPERRAKDGGTTHKPTWIIVDGTKHVATGCTPGETAEAEAKLADYLASKYSPARKERDIEATDT